MEILSGRTSALDCFHKNLAEDFKSVSRRIETYEFLLNCWRNDELSLDLKVPRSILEETLRTMKQYKAFLEASIKIEEVQI